MEESKHNEFLDGVLPGDEDDSGSTVESDGFLEGVLEDEDTEPQWKKNAQVEYQPEVIFHTSERMEEIDDEEVDLIVTSPPYNTDWDYGSHDDDLDYATEYLPMLARVFQEAYRVLRPGGRMCVNVPSLLRSGSSGGYPISSDVTRMVAGGGDNVFLTIEDEQPNDIPFEDRAGFPIYKLNETTDWVIREKITWFKDFNTDGLAPNGSFPRPWGVLLNNMHEDIIVFQKPGKREYDDMSEGTIEDSKINKTDKDMCDDVWFIHPDSWSPQYVDDEDIPVFPDELVRRCIQLWSYKGDTVLDPFAGRFTVGKVAREEDRWSIGYEIREDLEQDIKEYTNMQQMRFF